MDIGFEELTVAGTPNLAAVPWSCASELLGLLYPHGVRVDQAALVTMFPADLWQTVWNHMA